MAMSLTYSFPIYHSQLFNQDGRKFYLNYRRRKAKGAEAQDYTDEEAVEFNDEELKDIKL